MTMQICVYSCAQLYMYNMCCLNVQYNLSTNYNKNVMKYNLTFIMISITVEIISPKPVTDITHDRNVSCHCLPHWYLSSSLKPNILHFWDVYWRFLSHIPAGKRPVDMVSIASQMGCCGHRDRWRCPSQIHLGVRMLGQMEGLLIRQKK